MSYRIYVFNNCHSPFSVLGITSKTTVKVPKSKLGEYKKLFRKCGLSKNVKVKAI